MDTLVCAEKNQLFLQNVSWFQYILKWFCGRNSSRIPLWELTVLPQTFWLDLGREEDEKEGQGRNEERSGKKKEEDKREGEKWDEKEEGKGMEPLRRH